MPHRLSYQLLCLRLFSLALVSINAQNTPTNLALKKMATASSEESSKNNLAALAIDGDPKTRWCASSPKNGEWLQVDLGEKEHLRAVLIHWEGNAAYRYKVEGSPDGRTWKLLVDQSANKNQNQTPTHSIDAADTRYLKVTYLGSAAGGWGSIRELEAFADAALPNTSSNGKSTTVHTHLVAPTGNDPLLKDLQIPEGFTSTIYAKPPEVVYPTFVKAKASGDLFVSVDRNGSIDREPHRGSIILCRDQNKDGVADEFHTFVKDVDSPRGIEWDGEWLYVMHPPHLSAFRDTDGDHIADEERRLVSGIAFDFKDRPADHTSNGVTLGIDGWLYLAIGDFGFMNAVGADGSKLQLRGGGVVRLRPDGSNLQIFSRGTRNIYELGVSPTLDIFSRDNTNDGGGWDVRLHHFTGLEHHGYPSLYVHFNEEIIQPLADYGGGSGTGALWLAEPGFPQEYSNTLITVDWGKGIYRHELVRTGGTFREVAQHEFIKCSRPNDIDVDAHSRLYVASWKEGLFTYDGEKVGYIAQLKPPSQTGKTAQPEAVEVSSTPTSALINEFGQGAKNDLAIQQELLRRKLDGQAFSDLMKLTRNQHANLAQKIAAIFTLKLGFGENANSGLVELGQGSQLTPYVLRALGDFPQQNSGGVEPFISQSLTSSNPQTRLEAVRALASFKLTHLAPQLIALCSDPDKIVNHTVINALAQLEAVDVCFAALDDPKKTAQHPGILRALQSLHQDKVVAGLSSRLGKDTPLDLRNGILKTLARLYYREGPWNGDGWGTRPDTTGPYYNRVTWQQSEEISKILKTALVDQATDQAALLAEIARNQIDLDNSLPTVLKLASKDPRLEESLVALVLGKKNTPSESIPLLIRIATAEDRKGELRLNTSRALARADDAKAVATAFDITLKRNRIDSIPHIKDWLRDELVANPSHENRYQWLVGKTHDPDNATATLAWACLLKLSQKNPLAPETKDGINKAVTEAQKEATSYTRLLNAIRDIKHQPATDLVREAAKHTDNGVAQAAQDAARSLRIDLSGTDDKSPKIADLKLEQVLLQVSKIKGDPKLGEALFTRQTCVACHTVSPDQALKGPYLGNITSIYKGRDLAQAILDPNFSIAQGFATNIIETKDGKSLMGFVTKESAEAIELRDLTGKVTTLKPGDIKTRSTTKISIMPPGLVAPLTVKEFAALLAYMESLNQ